MPHQLGSTVLIFVTLFSLSCVDDKTNQAEVAGELIAMERAALDRWGKGDSTGYLEIFAPDITYFNPFLDRRIDGFAEMSEYYLELAGEVGIEQFEMVDTRVQLHQDVAVLTYHLYNYRLHPDGGKEETGRWNSTKVYARVDENWRIVHNHWAFLKPELPQDDTARANSIDELVQQFFESGSYPSLSVGVVENDRLVYARSLGVADKASGQPATPYTLYEIGSVGKVFTTTVLAILHDRGALQIDDPVEKWVPAVEEVSRSFESGQQLTLEHLATHTSGLPGIPANVGHLPPFQWKGYSAEDLHRSFKDTELLYPAGKSMVYSTLGVGLLGHVMAVATRRPYEAVIAEELLLPLGMHDTVITLQPHQRDRYSVGYFSGDSQEEVPYYEYGILAGGGAHRSTVTDLALFLRAQWGYPGSATNPLNERVRSALHRIRWQSGEDNGGRTALGWFAEPHEGVGTIFSHRGRTAGHGAVVAFIPELRVGVILLTNRGGRDSNIMMAEFAEEILLEVVSRDN